ncbi:MAG TPA: hypothetical protein VMT34_13415 [Aggregatilineales bacterium]|nr:hypothetical protein [Aggregatilineales bacterium]
MIQVELTLQEQQLLKSILEDQLSDLRVEIVETDRRDYKEMLKDRKKILTQLLQKIQPVEEGAAR